MSQTLCNLLIHGVFHKKRTAPDIRRDDQTRLNSFIQRTCEAHKCPCLIANGPGDHIHFLIVVSPEMALSHLVGEMKRTSTLFLKQCDATYYHRFQWQSGYGGFSVSEKLRDAVYQYIAQQEEHHKRHSVQDEVELLLRNAGVTRYEGQYYWQ